MRKIDLFYQNVTNNLNTLEFKLTEYYIANKVSIEQNEIKSDKFTELSSSLEGLISEIKFYHHERNEFIENYLSLEKFLENYNAFTIFFTDFTFNISTYLLHWLFLIKKINTVKVPDIDLNTEIDISNFKIINLEETIIEENFIKFESNNLKKSIIVYSFGTTFETFIEEEIHSAHVDLLLIFLHLLSIENTIGNTQYVLLSLETSLDLKDLKSILKLQTLLNGKHIKSLEKYDTLPHQPIYNTFDFNEKYIQFDNIANVLNEYNHQIYLLDKFLKLYHVIENFMYKHKICSLEREKNGEPFHIRDFQVLYEKFNIKEITCIQDFFKEVFTLNYEDYSFQALIKNQWIDLETIDNTKIPHINSLFSRLSLKTQSYNYNNLKTNINSDMFAILVYKFRNSIVHNKDSELHFENTDIPIGVKFLLKHFFIPNLERIVFHLIINKNNIVWYQNNNLLLYNI